jgi:hypothetical protein
MSDGLADTVHSLAPWFLARYMPALERTARDNLCRVGFENWYPSIIDVRPVPLRKIPPKKRHLAARMLQEIRRPRFVGYILIRPLPWCRWDVNRLFDLTGCGNIVSNGQHPAKIEDFDVELMRLAEARGQFDTFAAVGPRFRIRIDVQTHQQWISQGKKLLNLDDARKFRLFLDAFGRIERIIAHAEEPEFTRSMPAAQYP